MIPRRTIIDTMSKAYFGITCTDAQDQGICVRCKQGGDYDEDGDYRIYGLCKKCREELKDQNMPCVGEENDQLTGNRR